MIGALALLGSVAVFARTQDPSFEFPGAKHVGYEQHVNPSNEARTVVLSQDEKQVSVSFTNATNAQVLEWLKGQGLNFAVADDQLNKNARISIQLNKVSLDRALRAIARAWDGRWVLQDDVYVFRKSAFGLFESPSVPSAEIARQSERERAGGAWQKQMEEEAKKWKDGSGFSAPQLAEGQVWVDGQQMPSPKAFSFESKDGKIFMNGKEMPMPKIIEKNGKVYMDGKELPSPKAFSFESKDGKIFMNGKEMPMPKIVEKNGKVYMDGKELPSPKMFRLETKNGKTYLDGKEVKGQTWTFGDKVGKEWPAMPSMPHTMRGQDMEGLYDSLTTMQMETMKRRGYLLYSDLNSKQRAYLGTMGGGSWSISFSNNGKSLTIKSDK